MTTKTHRHALVTKPRSCYLAAACLLAALATSLGIQGLLTGPPDLGGGYGVAIGQASVVATAILLGFGFGLLTSTLWLRTAVQLGLVLLVGAFIAYESLGPAHDTGFSPTGVLLFRQFAEGRVTAADMARIFGFHLPPSASDLHSLVPLTWNGDGPIYARFDLNPTDLPALEEQLSGTTLIDLGWQVAPPPVPLDWWDIHPAAFVQSTSNQFICYAVRQQAGRVTIYLVSRIQ